MTQKPIFNKLLIANRGEIACRIIKTCQKLGIKTVAVYSLADEQAKHVKMADEAMCIGPAPSKESYLRIDAIIDACLKTGAQAVHPGYGFLSENADFSAALRKNNIIFIGPDAHSIDAMGDKIHSKKLAKEAGVTTIPGFIGEITSHEQLLKMANEIGYPVMVKASGGGGGKGMHIAYNDKECVEYFDMCKEEAISAFNNGKMLVEKFVNNPRHIEIQVIADRHGNTLYLPERECSIQRRNQKVLEEAPSTFIDAATRKAMGEEAVAMARKVQYVTAGTVEMVVDNNRKFYFLEMNTRLQVEHPITELITGVDLVEQMIRAAANLPLSITQSSIKIHGHATEARVYAEDPTKNYFPSIGRLSGYNEPTGPGVRVDSGIIEGSQISVYYDPLIAKLSTWGETRDISLDRMNKSLDEYVIRGLKHNVCLLRDVINEPDYRAGRITTNYLPAHYPKGFVKAELSDNETMRLAVTVAAMKIAREANVQRLSAGSVTAPKRAAGKQPMQTIQVVIGDVKTLPVAVDISCDGAAFVDGEAQSIHSFTFKVGQTEGSVRLEWPIDGKVIHANFVTGEKGASAIMQFFGTDEVKYNVQYRGTVFPVMALSDAQAAVLNVMPAVDLAASAKKFTSPMPGVVVGVAVKVGDSVVAGVELITLEAMKMRNKLRAETDGVVKAVHVTVGKTVEDGALLIEFE